LPWLMSTQDFLRSLANLTGTNESISTLTSMIMFSPECSTLIDIIAQRISVPDARPTDRMVMLYLFDSVIRQAARDKRADIAAKLETCLPQCIHHVLGTPKNERNLQLVKRTIDLWKARNLFSPGVIMILENIVYRSEQKEATKHDKLIMKVYLGDDIHRVVLKQQDYASFESVVADSFELNRGSFLLKYLDDEQDLITVANDSDLQSAIQLFSNQSCCRFYVHMKHGMLQQSKQNEFQFSSVATTSYVSQTSIASKTSVEPAVSNSTPQSPAFHPERLPAQLLRPASPVPPHASNSIHFH